MVMSYIWTGLVAVSIFCSLLTGNGQAVGRAVMEGAQSGITLAIGIGGAICLWSGVGQLMQAGGITQLLSRLLRPVLYLLFPESRHDPLLAGDLSGNICANLLGLGNAATPMGVRAARQLADPMHPGTATHSLCRLVVLNTALIQLLPTNVAAIRSTLGCASPFGILPAVWITSLLSASLGLFAAWFLGKAAGFD